MEQDKEIFEIIAAEDRRQRKGIQDDYNRKGLISERGERKKAFYVMQEWYRQLMQ